MSYKTRAFCILLPTVTAIGFTEIQITIVLKDNSIPKETKCADHIKPREQDFE